MKKENRQLNELERHLLQRMKDLDSFRKFADELLLELIASGTVQPRTDDEINHICTILYQDLEMADAEESQSSKQKTH